MAFLLLRRSGSLAVAAGVPRLTGLSSVASERLFG
jgi:hypothetical protein